MAGMPSNTRSQWWGIPLDAILFASLVLAAGLVTATLFGDYRQIFHSDGALKSVLAAQGAAEGRFLPHLWVYANGDLLFVGPLLVSSLLWPLFGVGYSGNAAAGLICYLYLLATVFATCRHLESSNRRAAIAAAAVAAGGLGVSNFEFVIGQAAYPVYAALALSLFSMASSGTNPRRGLGGWLWIFLALAGSALFCSANPVRGVATMLAPVLAGGVAGALLAPRPFKERLRLLLNPTMAAILAGGITGSALYYAWLLPSVSNYDAAAKLELAAPAQVIHHAVSLLPAWYEYFRVAGPWGTLDAPTRLLQTAVWLFATLVAISPVYAILTQRTRSPRLFVFSWIVLAAYGSSFAALSLSAVLFTGPIEMRYATFPIYGGICITAILASRIRWPGLSAVALLAMGLLGAASAPTGQRLHAAPHIADFGINYADRTALMAVLQRQGVGTALAAYWNSYVLTVLSDGGVFAYPIGLDTHVFPFAHHAPRLVLHGTNGSRQAVILSKADVDNPQAWSAVRYQFGDPATTFKSGPFTVWIYDTDLAQMVFGVGYGTSEPVAPSKVHVDLSLGAIPACGNAAEDCKSEVVIRNSGSGSLATAGSLPLRLGIQGLGKDGEVVAWDLGRVDFPRPLKTGDSVRAIVDLPDQAPVGVVQYHLCLLQEGVAWMCERTSYDSGLANTP